MNERHNLKALPADAVRTRRLERLAEARARIAAAGGEPMSLEEIAAEVTADRARRRKAARVFLANAGRVAAAGVRPLSADRIQAEIDALRSARRKPRRATRRVRADRGRAKRRSS